MLNKKHRFDFFVSQLVLQDMENYFYDAGKLIDFENDSKVADALSDIINKSNLTHELSFDLILPIIINYSLDNQKKIFENSYPYQCDDNQDSKDSKFEFARLLYQLEVQVTSLHKRKEIEACTVAANLNRQLKEIFTKRLDNECMGRYGSSFYKDTHKALTEAKNVLAKHRGCKNIIANLLLCVATLGLAHIGAAIAEKITGVRYTEEFGLFALTKTKSAKYLEDAEKFAETINI